jgi:methylase of polypeptide subunit release factors
MKKLILEDYLRLDVKKHRTESGVNLLYFENCSAGGERHNKFIIDIIQKTGKAHYNKAHEWCCGHAGIGFELLGRNVCDHVTLSDKFLPAIVGCQFTATENSFKNRVSTYLIKEFDNLPTHEKWDLIVADPPHWDTINLPTESSNDFYNDDALRQVVDLDWKSHLIFFNSVEQYLNPDADIYLFEGYYGSTPETFMPMINNSNLEIIGVYNQKTHPMPSTDHYILHLKVK